MAKAERIRDWVIPCLEIDIGTIGPLMLMQNTATSDSWHVEFVNIGVPV